MTDALGHNYTRLCDALNYTADNLGEYSSRLVPGAADIIGGADVKGTVTVNGQSAYRHGQFYQTALTLTNTSGAIWQSLTSAVTDGSTNNSVIGSIFLRPSTENFTCDLGGNLTSHDRWTNMWVAENRLITTRGLSGLTSGAKAMLLLPRSPARCVKTLFMLWVNSLICV